MILSREEVKALLEASSDLRHRAMLAILYASGLRVSEVARLKVADIDRGRNVLWVRSGKGKKDRQALLPPKLRELLRCYWRSRRTGGMAFSRCASRPADLGEIDLHGLPESGACGWRRASPFIRTCSGTLRHTTPPFRVYSF